MVKLPSFTAAFASIQWFVFIFANTAVVPISIGAAFSLDSQTIAELIRNSLVFTGIACMLQGAVGHRFPLLEGHSGFMWGLVLNLCYASSALGMSLPEIGGGIASGMLIAGAITAVLAAFNLLNFMEKIFTPMVMSVFLFLLTFQLVLIFFDGMFKRTEDGLVLWPETLLAFAVAVFTCLLKIVGSEKMGNFSILIGIAAGWLTYRLLFPEDLSMPSNAATYSFTLFPLGEPNLNVPIIVVTCVATLINLSNSITAVKTVARLYGEEATRSAINRSYALNGLFSMAGAALGLVSYAPFASTIGFLQSTGIFDRKPYLIGGLLMSVAGIVPMMSGFLATLPVTIGNAVLFAAYLQLLGTSINSIRDWAFDSVSIFRLALPVLTGLGVLSVDPSYFNGVPTLVQPLVSNGFIVGVLLSVVMELIIPWERRKRQT
jgi:xanthine/uracil permease